MTRILMAMYGITAEHTHDVSCTCKQCAVVPP